MSGQSYPAVFGPIRRFEAGEDPAVTKDRYQQALAAIRGHSKDNPCRLEGMSFFREDFSGLDLRGIVLVDCTLERCDLSGSDFSRADLEKSRIERCDIDAATFADARILGATFELNTGVARWG